MRNIYLLIVVLGAAPAWGAPMPCTPGHVLDSSIGGVGVASGPVSDAALNPGTNGNTYVLQNNFLYARKNSDGTTAWGPKMFPVTFSNVTTLNPVPLSGSGTEVLFLINGTVLYKVKASDGTTMAQQDLAGFARDACPGAKAGELAVLAPPAVQLCDFSNTTFKAGAPGTCTDGDDLVITPTHFARDTCPGLNRVFALRASDLGLPAAGGVNAPGWVFGNSSTNIVDPAADGCQVIYDDSGSAEPFNNTVLCGTDQINVLHNTLWALRTHTTGISAHLGFRQWASVAGRILGRPVIKPGTTRIYYGTNEGLTGTFRVKFLATGTDLYNVATASPINMPVWPEFRPPTPGLTNTTFATSADGNLRRFEETSGMAEVGSCVKLGNFPGGTIGDYTTAATVLPSAGRIYVGASNGTVRQLEAATCDNGVTAANFGYMQFAASTSVFFPTLDFDDFNTSTDIDRVSVVNYSGQMLRFCVPFGDGGSFLHQSSAGPPAPQPQGCTTPQFAGDCTCDSQCAGFAPDSPCYTKVCQMRNNATEGVCVLLKKPNTTFCNNGVSCDCDKSFAPGGSCPASCATGSCDRCNDGVCVGNFRNACTCSKVGDLSCDTSLGQSCCGGGVCADLRSSNTNCGACGTVCPSGTRCSDGECKRDHSECAHTDDQVLNALAQGDRLPGGGAIEYSYDGSGMCPALIALDNGQASSLQMVDPGGNQRQYNFHTAGGSPLLHNVNGISSAPDGKFWWANLLDPDKQATLEVSLDAFGTDKFEFILQTAAGSPAVPFTPRLYNGGFENRPAIHLKAYPGKMIVFLSNYAAFGDIRKIDPALPGGGSQGECLPGWCGNGTPIEALEYSIRLNGDGVLLAAQGTNLHVICDQFNTNEGASCRMPSFSINLANTRIYPNTRPDGSSYMPIDRIYSIAVDRFRRSIYVELGSRFEQQIVVIEDLTLSSVGAVARNLVDVEVEHELNVNTLKRAWNDSGGRLAVSKNGFITRIAVSPTAPGGMPTFYSGEIQ